MPKTWQDAIDESLRRRAQDGHLRRRRMFLPTGPVTMRDEHGRELVNFASNNYLGLTHHQRIAEALASSCHGSGAAELISGRTPEHVQAEKVIANWKRSEAAVLLPSGYQANLTAVQTSAAVGAAGGVRFLIDKLAHASLIDAIRSTGAPFRVFPHNHLGKLERLLHQAPPDELQVVVTESIFSMDGDQADLAGIVALKIKFPFLLLLDEAHASGIYGNEGSGLASELGVANQVDMTVITCSKALGCSGGAIAASQAWIDAVANFGRAFIFSTAVSPAMAAAISEAVSVVREEPERAARVRRLASSFRNEMLRAGLRIDAGDSPIIPLICGSASAALAAAEHLETAGLLVVAVRPPTVPPGSSRLRITFSTAHTDDQIARLLQAIQSLPTTLETLEAD